MRHGKKRLQLSRFTSWHKATLKSLARNIIIHQSIKTSISRAKAVRPLVEKLISLAKENTLSAKRQAFKVLGDHKLVSLLFNDIGPLFAKRNSGYTRIISLVKRRGDNAQIVIFELTDKKVKEIKKLKKAKEENLKPKAAESSLDVQAEKSTEKKAKEPTTLVKDRQETTKKPAKKFLGGIRSIFKKQRDSL
jgi:large subunit ribosomal protein L17